jgi:2-methylcitrate dehydratase PrpD
MARFAPGSPMKTATAPAAAATIAPPAADRLASHAAGLDYADLPAPIVAAAKTCLIDGVACAIFGAVLPWSRAIAGMIAASGSEGACAVPGFDHRLDPRQAALALGAFAHAFELDSLRKPGAGAHPGATVALPAFAMAQAGRRSGRDLVAAIVAGCEVSFRIGAATLHTPELEGFHAPGIVGPFGAAAASGKMLGLSPEQLAYAFGIAGSCTGGLLAFARSGQGGMVKRLHLGRAAESGVLAAQLASRGYDGPRTILEGEFGVLASFCSKSDPEQLTARLGTFFETSLLCIKPYACHVTAQAPIELLRALMVKHGFAPGDIAAIEVAASEKVASHHSEQRPADIMLGQYSVPFSLAVAGCRDPADPASFADDSIHNASILDLAARIKIVPGESGWGAGLMVTLRDGRTLSGTIKSFRGCPETPMSLDDIAAKFRRLTRGKPGVDALLETLLDIENVADVAALKL